MRTRINKKVKISLFVALLIVGGLPVLAPTASGAEPVNVAVIAALTGPAGAIGQSQLAGAKVAEMHINQEGGILGRKVRIVEKDTAASPSAAVKVVREAVMNENTKFLVGVVSSGVGLAIAPLMEELDSLLIIAAAQTEKLTGKNCSPYVFRICTNAVAVVRAAAELASERYPNVKRWAGICPDYEYGHTTWRLFKEAIVQKNPGATIVGEQFPKFKATNYEPQILKLLEAKPEGLYSSLYAGDFVTFVKQARKYKFFDNIKAFINHSVAMEVAIPLGKEMVDVWGGGHYYKKAYDNPLNEKFVQTHKKLFEKDPLYASSETYSALYALKYAIEKANSFETKDVIKALRGLTFDSITGKRYIRPEDHQTIRDQIFLHFQNTEESPGWKIGEIKSIWSKEVYPKLDEPEGGCKMKW